MKSVHFAFALLLLFIFSVAHGDELSLRESIRKETRFAFVNENFAELEKLAYTYSQQDLRTPSGAQKISLFDDGLKSAMIPSSNEGEKYFPPMEEKVLRWIKAYPNSSAAHLAYARALSVHGWFFRGEGYANTVPDSAWKSFYRYQNLACNYLNKIEKISVADTGWYAFKIECATSLGWDETRFKPLMEEALIKSTDDDRIFYAIMSFLLPKWHGDADQLDKFISTVVSNTQPQRGMELYARLYSAASQFQYQHQLFRDSKVSWQKMKAGFEDVLKRYPDPWNVNLYAHFSCLAGDKEKTATLMEIIGTNPILLLWKPAGNEVFNSCQAWAQSP